MLRYLYLLFIRNYLRYAVRLGVKIDHYYLIVHYLDGKVTATLFVQSSLFLLDTVFDWVTIFYDYKSEAGQKVIPNWVVPCAIVFAACGTVLYLCDAFDIIDSVVSRRISPSTVLLANIFFEDVPQIIIAIIVAIYVGFGNTSSSFVIWGFNVATSIFGFAYKMAVFIDTDAKTDIMVPSLFKITRITAFLLKLKIELDLPKLHDLYEEMRRQLVNQEGRQNEKYEVVTDMPGGVLLVMKLLKLLGDDETERNSTQLRHVEIKFGEGSFIDLPQIEYIKHNDLFDFELNSGGYVCLDFWKCRIGYPETDLLVDFGNLEPIPTSEEKDYKSYKDSDCHCLLSLLSFVGMSHEKGLKIKVRIWPPKSDVLREIRIFPGSYPLSKHTMVGLCAVLAMDNGIEEIQIVDEVHSSSIYNDIHDLISIGTIKDNLEKSFLKRLVWKKNNTEITSLTREPSEDDSPGKNVWKIDGQELIFWKIDGQELTTPTPAKRQSV